MKRYLLVVIGLSMVACHDSTWIAAAPVPRPEENTRQEIFPPGRYVLAGGENPAQGEDVKDLMTHFRLRSGQYILSGGPKPNDPLLVGDDIEISQNDKKLFIDADQQPTSQNRGKKPARYVGQPIVLVLDEKAGLNIRMTEHWGQGLQRSSELWLHRHDGAKMKITDKLEGGSTEQLPHVFFERQIELVRRFELPKSVNSPPEVVIDMPRVPASLLK